MILVLFGGARTALVAILVANFAFFPQILRLNHHQLGCRPNLSAPCLMLSYVRYSFEEIYSLIVVYFKDFLDSTTLPSLIPFPFPFPSFPISSLPFKFPPRPLRLRCIDPLHPGIWGMGERSALLIVSPSGVWGGEVRYWCILALKST